MGRASFAKHDLLTHLQASNPNHDLNPNPNQPRTGVVSSPLSSRSPQLATRCRIASSRYGAAAPTPTLTPRPNPNFSPNPTPNPNPTQPPRPHGGDLLSHPLLLLLREREVVRYTALRS